jgi:hypothetical protein
MYCVSFPTSFSAKVGNLITEANWEITRINLPLETGYCQFATKQSDTL